MPKTFNKNEIRPVRKIAREILDHWRAQYADAPKRPGFVTYAWPYLEAMLSLETTSRQERYGMEDAQMIVLYFLNNVTGWKGDFARAYKAELNYLLEVQNAA